MKCVVFSVQRAAPEDIIAGHQRGIQGPKFGLNKTCSKDRHFTIWYHFGTITRIMRASVFRLVNSSAGYKFLTVKYLRINALIYFVKQNCIHYSEHIHFIMVVDFEENNLLKNTLNCKI